MRFLVDVDGVLADFCKGYAKAMRFAPEPLSYSIMARFEAADFKTWAELPEVVGTVNRRWFWTKGAYDLHTFEKLPAYEKELDHLARLPGEIYLLTSLPVGLRDQRFVWLGKHHVIVDGVLFCNNPEEKLGFVNDLRADHFVDDRGETLLGMVGKTKTRLWVRDRPWNRGIVTPVITRIKSLKELL